MTIAKIDAAKNEWHRLNIALIPIMNRAIQRAKYAAKLSREKIPSSPRILTREELER